MNRPAGVVVTAVLQTLGSLSSILIAVLFVVLPRIVPKNASQPELPGALYIGMGIFYLLLGVVGLATAVGVFKLKQWARYSTLIFAGILGALCLLVAVGFAFLPLTSPPSQPGVELPPHFELVFKAAMIGTQLALVALGAWWLYYFNRGDIKLRFEGRTTGAATLMSRRPISIAILSIFNLIGSSIMLLLAWNAPPVAFLGMVLHGASSRAFYVASALAGFYVGAGLWRLVPTSRIVAIAFQLFYLFNATLFYVLPGRAERAQRLLAEVAHKWHFANFDQSAQSFWLGAWWGITSALLFAGVTIYILVTRRSAFQSAAPPPLPPVPAS
jgi:hypothetical protein